MVIFLHKKIKFIIINSLSVFLLGFLVHNIYDWLPSFITTIFPVNESLYEHVKLIYISILIVGICYYFLTYKKEEYHNYFFSLYLTCLFNISLFYIIFLPFYYQFGENLVVTLIIYLISIIVSQYLNYYIITKTKNCKLVNILGIVLLTLNYLILLYFTYNPLQIDFFFDPINRVYGIYK